MSHRISHSLHRLFLSVVAITLVVAFAEVAHADDKVDRLIAKLQTSSDYKVRLSAALNLAKIRDKRAIPAFMRALADSDKTVRGVAAAALGKIVDSSVPEGRRTQVLGALKRAASQDKNDFVRKQAQKAFDTVSAIGGAGEEPSAGGGKIFIDVSDMATKVDGEDALRALMRKTALGTFKKKASDMSTDWAGSGQPSKKQLAAKGFTGFHVHGTLTELTSIPGGGGMQVSCKVSMLLATYPDKSMFGFLNGGAQVQTGKSDRDVRFAKEDCVAAVVEDLIARKIIPTIKVRAR